MASRIMHLIIAKKINEQLSVNFNRFSMGNILPDVFDHSKSSKKDSHFIIPGKIAYGERYLDYDRFLSEHKSDLEDDIYLGYLGHLIADDEWLRKIYVPLMIDENEKVIVERQDVYYGDYGRLNRRLIEKYGLINNYSYETFPMERICVDRYKEHLKFLKEDFERTYENYDLEIMNFNDVIEYIESTTDLIIKYFDENQLR